MSEHEETTTEEPMTEETTTEETTTEETTTEEATTGDEDPLDQLATMLERVRTEPQLYAVGFAAMAIVGIILSAFHWLGLVVGGALVGTISKTISRAIGAGLLFALIVFAVFAAMLGGAATRVPEMTPIVYVTIGAGLGLPILGSLVRGVFP